MKICIVGAGLATRLQPITNHIPKFLVNIGKQTGLVELIKYWARYSNDFTVIVHPKYEALTRAYFDMYYKDSAVSLTIKTCKTALGTAHTIDTCLGEEYYGSDVLFTWCDVIPVDKISVTSFTASDDSETSSLSQFTVFTHNNEQNRYIFADGVVKKDPHAKGDVIGIYHVRNYDGLEGTYLKGEDFADVLSHLSKRSMRQIELESIIDYGDMPKLMKVLDAKDGAREFNSVEMSGEFVIKKPLTAQGERLMEFESHWYQTVAENYSNVKVPRAYKEVGGKGLVLDRVNGVPVFDLINTLSPENRSTVLKNMRDGLSELHEARIPMSYRLASDDIKKEAFDKLINRYKEIEVVINTFGENISVVNGIDISTIGNLCDSGIARTAYKRLLDALMAEYKDIEVYSAIHGDSQMSNTLSDPETLEITFIDPRGYFGNTAVYGIPDYDIAKMLYSITGYESLNNSKSFHLTDLTQTSIDFEIRTIPVRQDDMEPFSRIHWLWVCVIWLGLAGYIKNDPIKSLAAHYHGLAMTAQVLDGKIPKMH